MLRLTGMPTSASPFIFRWNHLLKSVAYGIVGDGFFIYTQFAHISPKRGCYAGVNKFAWFRVMVQLPMSLCAEKAHFNPMKI